MTNLDVTWDDAEQSIVRLDVHADYTWTEFYAAVEQVSALVAAKRYRCDILVNLGKYAAESSGVPAIQKAIAALDRLPDNVGLVVIVVPLIASFLLNAAKRLDSRAAARARTATTLDKARHIIFRERETA